MLNLFIVIWSIISCLNASTYIISQQFFTNSFTENDLTPWALTGSSVPLMQFSTCGSNRIFGGDSILIGDPINPSKITRTWNNLIPHYSIQITAQLYKIDSWPNNTLFVMADGTTVALYTFNSTNAGPSDICGTTTPIMDSINTNFNDNIVSLSVSTPHFLSSLTVTLVSNLVGTEGSWGLRNLNITMQACDESCLTCTNSSQCATCDTVNGFILSGPFCICANTLAYRQKKIPCTVIPCAVCIFPAACLAGYYYSAITLDCQPCNIACSACNSPVNSISTCTSCAPGFIGNPTSGVVCASCYSGCATCISTASTACLSCNFQYFYYSLNKSCLSQCPSGYYGQQKSATCYICTSPCASCMGSSASAYFCLTCIAGYYLWNNTCLSTCPSLIYSYAGSCITSCPATTYPDNTMYTCLACGSNCQQCISNLVCTVCLSNAFLLSNICYLSCPTSYYGSASNKLCINCDPSCLSCNGPLNSNCISCSSGAVLLNGACFTSCPSYTYSSLCLLCDSTCLSCTGPSPNNCLTCPYPKFFHLNYSSCVSGCTKGQLANNFAMTCARCLNGQVASFDQCVPCSDSCLTCSGPTFLECSGCYSSAQLVQSACVLQKNEFIIYSPQLATQSVVAGLQALLICYVLLAVTADIIFEYKSNFLPTLQILQILSFVIYLSIELSENTQESAILLYSANFSSLIRLFSITSNPSLPSKFQVMGKTGYFVADACGLHLCMVFSIIVYFLTKYFSKYFQFMAKCHKKINPYIITYTFRLVFLQWCLDLTLFIYCFSASSGIGIASLVLVVIDILGIIFACCWRIKTVEDGSQVALFYNNEIGQKQESQKLQPEEEKNNSRAVQNKIHSNKILPSVLNLCLKIPIPITILLFINNSFTQSICYSVYFAFYLLLMMIIPYRRRIYRVTIFIGCFSLLLNSLIAVLVARGATSLLFDILWLTTITIVFALAILQFLFNYEYFFSFFSYLWYHIKECYRTAKAEQNKNQQSQSNLTANEGMDEEAPNQDYKPIQQKNNSVNDILTIQKQILKHPFSSTQNSYLQLGKSKWSSTQSDIKLDLNL